MQYNPQDVFPQPNVSPEARPWARDLTKAVRNIGYEVKRQGLLLSGNNSALSGQMAVAARQIDKLEQQQQEVTAVVNNLTARSTHSVSPSNLQLILGSSSGSSGPVTRTVNLPAPADRRRNALIVGGGVVAWTGTSTGSGIGDSVTVGIEFRQGTTRRWFDMASAGSAKMFSFSDDETFNLVVPVQVPSGGSDFDIRLWVGATSSGGQTNRGARLENMFFSIIYGDAY